MKRIKIIVIGNSVPMRVRPPLAFPNNKNYTVILQGLLENELGDLRIDVDNRAIGASILRDTLNSIESLIQEFPHYYIINFGVVDASTREIPFWFYKYINKPVKSRFKYFCSGLYAHSIQRHRPFFVKLRGKKSWVHERKFAHQFNLLITALLKETNARLICLSINPASDRIEKQLPGSYQNCIKFNKHIKEIASKHGQMFIDTTELISDGDYPDGVHYSHKGHQVIAAHLKESIIKDLKKQKNEGQD